MAVMVAGGSGFIGSHLVRRLGDLGEKVVVFDAAPNMALLEDVQTKIEIVKGDATQMVDILQAIQHYGIEEVYHLIALLADIQMEAKRRFPWPPAYNWERAQQELGYQPLYDLEKGIKDFIQEARKKSS